MDLNDYCSQVARQADEAAQQMAGLTTQAKDNWLRDAATRLRANVPLLLDANIRDIELAAKYGLNEAEVDRLRLDATRIESIARGMLAVAELPDPCGQMIDRRIRPNGLEIRKLRVPLGVIFFIYESRPNVTADAAAICIKSGNAVILRGGKEAANSSRAIIDILAASAGDHGIPIAAIQLIATAERAAVGHLLAMSQWIDLAIPRGGESLIRRVVDEATMPVLKHFHGNCHVYVDRSADLEMAIEIVHNAKCQRMGVCNAAESLLVHREIASSLLPRLAEKLRPHEIELRVDRQARDLLAEVPAADGRLRDISPQDLDTEYLGPILSICVVDDLQMAITHINHHGSGHTDAIVALDANAIEQFTKYVDSAAVMVNASTRFNDGAEFGLGAEIGISTDKFHARGPCGLEELTTYKYVVLGNGQIRE